MSIHRPQSQSDDLNVICPYCEASYQAEAEDYSERERDEKRENCGKNYMVYQNFDVTHYTHPKEETSKCA